MSVWSKLIGTQAGQFILGLTGVRLKNNAGNLDVKNNADTAFADIKVHDAILHNTSSGYDVTLETSDSTTGSYSLTLPVDVGSPSQVLTTDGAGVLSWSSVAAGASHWSVDSTSIAFGSSATVTAFTLPANAVVDKVSIIIDTAFDGAPTMSVGVNGGSASKYAGSGDSLMSLADRFDILNQSVANGSPEDLEIYYTAGGATTGAGRVLISYCIPV